jgi:hypothetical protein
VTNSGGGGRDHRVDVGGVSVSTWHYIGGRRVPSPATFEDRSPLDWSMVLADVAAGDASTADDAVAGTARCVRGLGRARRARPR